MNDKEIQELKREIAKRDEAFTLLSNRFDEKDEQYDKLQLSYQDLSKTHSEDIIMWGSRCGELKMERNKLFEEKYKLELRNSELEILLAEQSTLVDTYQERVKERGIVIEDYRIQLFELQTQNKSYVELLESATQTKDALINKLKIQEEKHEQNKNNLMSVCEYFVSKQGDEYVTTDELEQYLITISNKLQEAIRAYK